LKSAFRFLNITTQPETVENIGEIIIREPGVYSKVSNINKKALLFKVSIKFKPSFEKQTPLVVKSTVFVKN